MKFVLSALAAASLLVGIAALQSAEARCFWNGFETVCVRHGGPMFYGYRHWYRDFDRFDRPIYRDWY